MLTTIRLLFVSAVFGLFFYINYQTITQPTLETTEGRPLASLPALPLGYADIQKYFNDIDVWASDRMHYRQFFIASLNSTRLYLGFTTIGNVVVGKEKWLFYNSKSSGESDDARGATQFTPDELARWKRYLIYRNEQAKQYGSKFIFFIPPNKSTVYAEYLPNNYTRLSDNTRVQQLVDVMRDTGVTVLDARKILSEGKKAGQIYLKNDTHWNMLGANYAQYSIMLALAGMLPDIQPRLFPFHDASAAERVELNHPDDLYLMMGLRPGDLEPYIPVVEGVGNCVGKNDPANLRQWPLAVGDCSRASTMENDPEWNKSIEKDYYYVDLPARKFLFHGTVNPHGKYSLLMVNDSYFEMLQPFLSNQFKSVHFVGLGRPIVKEAWIGFLDATHPDIIIEEMLERALKESTPRAGADYQ